MDMLIVTGVSGAGKTQALHALEDIGYFCIDNIPAEMLEQFIALCEKNKYSSKIAVGMDIRAVSNFGDFLGAEKALFEKGYSIRMLYLDASDDVLIRRFKETRRKHPLMDDKITVLQSAIMLERDILSAAKAEADYFIDTSALSNSQLFERIAALFSQNGKQTISIQVMSFGFKHGIPADADLVFDVRCLPNPHYIKELRPLTGRDEKVSGYIFGFEESVKLLEHYRSLLDFSIPLYMREGKTSLVIAFGCTGGKHRSVAFAESIGHHIEKNYKQVSLFHRDFNR